MVAVRSKIGRVEKYTLAGRPSAFTIIIDEKLRPIRLRHAFPSEYLNRLIIQNTIFGDDIHLEAFSADYRFKTSQPYRDGILPAPEDIVHHLVGQGFQMKISQNDEPYYHHIDEGLIVTDTKPENWMMDMNKNIVPIDLIIVKIYE